MCLSSLITLRAHVDIDSAWHHFRCSKFWYVWTADWRHSSQYNLFSCYLIYLNLKNKCRRHSLGKMRNGSDIVLRQLIGARFLRHWSLKQICAPMTFTRGIEIMGWSWKTIALELNFSSWSNCSRPHSLWNLQIYKHFCMDVRTLHGYRANDLLQ